MPQKKEPRSDSVVKIKIDAFSANTLRGKFNIAIAISCVLFATSVLSYQFFVWGPEAVKLKELELESRLNREAERLNALSRERVALAVNLARRGEFFQHLAEAELSSPRPAAEWEKIIGSEVAKEVESFPEVLGAGIFFEPKAFDPDKKYRGFYAHWVPPTGGSRKVEFTMSKALPQAGYHDQGWYRTLIPAGWNPTTHLFHDIGWSEPYRDPVTLVPMISAVAAMYSQNATLIGVGEVDWNLDQVTETINAARPTVNTIAVLFSPKTKTFASVAGLQNMNLDATDKARWMPYLLLNAPEDRFEMVPAEDSDGLPYRAYSRVLGNGLIYSFIIPERDLFGDLTSMAYRFAAIVLAAMFFVFFALTRATQRLLSGLQQLTSAANRYARGDYKDSCSVESNDELDDLAHSFQENRDYHRRLTKNVHLLTLGELDVAPLPVDENDEAMQMVQSLHRTISNYHQEMKRVEAEVAKGNTDVRFNSTQFTGAWRQLAESSNQILENVSTPVRDAIRTCNAAAQGDSAVRMAEEARGVFEELRSALNSTLHHYDSTHKRMLVKVENLDLARESAVLSARGKSELLSSACSDFQELLREIRDSFTELTLETWSDRQRGLLSDCRGSVGNLLALSAELMNYAQIEEGHVDVITTQFNLHKLLFVTKDILCNHARSREQTFRLTVESEVPELVVGDPQMLQGVLLNLGSQAIRYTEAEGTVTINVRLECTTSATYTIGFSIADTGGTQLSRKRAEAITGLRGKNGPKDQLLSGGGLGLIIAQRLVELIGGSLTVDNRVGLGALYSLPIPFIRPEAADANVDERSDTTFLPSLDTEAKDPVNVLLVEDDIISQKVAAHLLRQQGCSVRVASSAEEAFQHIDSHKFDVIIMDLKLPVIDGIEATLKIRTGDNKTNASVPIIALTAHPLAFEENRCRNSGMNGYMLKPLSPSSTRELLSNVVERFKVNAPPLKSDHAPKGKVLREDSGKESDLTWFPV